MFLFSVFTMCDSDLMEVKRFCEDGEKHCNEGKLKKAIESFKKALEKAKSTEDRHLENVCSYNLASVHAANGDKQKLEQNLKDLSNQFIKDNLPEGERSMIYLRAVADRSPWQYEQALKVTNDSKKQIYLLKQLLKQCKDKQDKDKQIEYLERLQTVYEVQREDIRCLEVACQRARLLYREKTTEALLEVLEKVEKKLGECDTESLKTNSVPIWNEVGLMYTLLKKEDKALQCFENGLKRIHDKNTASILKTAVLKQNIGAVRYMKGEFVHAKKSDEEAIQQYDEYVAERKKSTSNGKSLQNGGHRLTCLSPSNVKRTQKRGTQVYHYDDGRMTYWQLKEDNGEGRIYEALKDDKEAEAGAARCCINLGEAQVKLDRKTDAFVTYLKAKDLALKGDKHTTMQAWEALASVARKNHDTRAESKYLQEALKFSVEVPGKDQGFGACQPEYANYNYQRIVEKLSQLPVTLHESPRPFSSEGNP